MVAVAYLAVGAVFLLCSKLAVGTAKAPAPEPEPMPEALAPAVAALAD